MVYKKKKKNAVDPINQIIFFLCYVSQKHHTLNST